MLVYVLATVLFLPGSILTLGAGFAYGVGARHRGRLDRRERRVLPWHFSSAARWPASGLRRASKRNPRFAAIDRAVGREGLKIVLLTRLSPVFPFNLLNYAFGLTTVSLRDYVLGSLVGMLPGTVMYVYLGSLITSLSELAAGRTFGRRRAADLLLRRTRRHRRGHRVRHTGRAPRPSGGNRRNFRYDEGSRPRIRGDCR